MQTCAYCDKTGKLTREHVIPDWYNDVRGEAETFSARAPLTHLKGDLLVKDVCSGCNNGVLSSLDGYGKELYERYFAVPTYWGETVAFDYDADRLIRWLLKLSYNSARAQNADVRVLREYRKVMLCETPVPDRVRCWLHLVGATCFDGSAKLVRPARRDEQGQPGVREPLWFRIGQFRLRDFQALSLVQRSVVINSFFFTLLVARADAAWPCPEFDRWIKEFPTVMPFARPVLPGLGRLTLKAEGDHAAASLYPLLQHFPTRFVLKDRLLPPLDQGVSALLDDLEFRGLLEETLVVMMGEFGRTPKIGLSGGPLCLAAITGPTFSRLSSPAAACARAR